MKKYIAVLFYLLVSLLVKASASNLLFPKHEDSYLGNFRNLKLPYDANTVNTIYQDNNGLIWIGTKRGLVNYNGFNYHLCYYGKNIPDENTIQAIAQVDKKYLYIGTDNGIRKLNLYTWTFDKIETELTAIKAVRTLALFDGKLWIGTRDEGLFYYEIKQKKLHKIPSRSFSHKLVYDLLPINDKLFIGSYGGLNVYDRKMNRISTVVMPNTKEAIVNSLAYDSRNRCVWIGTDGKLLQYDLNHKQFVATEDFPGTYLKSIVVDAQTNRLFIGTEMGLLTYRVGTKTFGIMEHDIHNSHSLCNNLIYNLFKDRQNNIWVATDNGISMLQQSPLIQEIKLSDLIDTNKGNLFMSMLVDGNSGYWLGGENGLLHITKECCVWYNTANSKYKLNNNSVRAIYKDRSKQIWIATDGGIARLDAKTMQFVYCKVGNKQNNTNWTYGIYEDTAHRMWIATYMSGLLVVDKNVLEKSNLTPYPLKQENVFRPNEIKSVYQISTDPRGDIWANTNKGLVCISPKDSKFEQTNIYLDNFICDGGVIWYSDQGAIYKYDIRSKRKSKIPYQISYGSVNSLVSTPSRVWISSVDGISYINKKTLNVYPCDMIDKHYKCAMYDGANKRILFGGEDGLATLNIEKFDKNYRKNAAVISAMYCDTVLIPIGTNTLRNVIEVPSFRDISIELASYAYPSQGEVFYYKWGHDKEWRKIKTGNNLLEYPIMPSGRNVLEISLSDPKFDKSAVISIYEFSVPYPWYLSSWAWMAYVVLFISGCFLVFKMQKRRNEKVFERKAKEKTLELTKMKMDFFVNVSHELKTPLSLIIAPLGKLLSECTNSKMRDTLHGIHRNALKLNELIYKIIDDKQTEYETENSVLRSHVEFVTLIKNCVANFQPIIAEKSIAVEFTHHMEELWLNVDVIKMETVFTNLLSNAIKHVANNLGMVKIELLLKDDNVMVMVKDNGCGISATELPLVFIKHYQGKMEKKDNHGTGIGLFLVKKYIELHQGKVFVENDKGAVFTVVLPLSVNGIVKNDRKTLCTVSDNTNESILPVVLIVDDNVEVVDFLCSSLSKKYKCLKAFDGKEALVVLQKQQPDLLIVDEMMPVMNGLDLVKAIRHDAKTENLPVVMLTAKDDFDTEMKSIKVGVDVFISKPFDFNKLLLQVARLIKRTQSIKKSTHIEQMLEAPSIEGNGEAKTSDELFMKELLRSIEENMDKEGYNVSMISEILKIDQKQLYRKIKQLTGKTPVIFLRTMRLKRAAELLKQNRFTISEVMYMVGISNASYFTKCFSAEYGMTPKQFVQEHNS